MKSNFKTLVWTIVLPVLFSLLLIPVFLYLLGYDFNFLEHLSDSHYEMLHIASLYDAFTIVLTFIVVGIAWSQLKGIVKIGQADFLLRIDQRFGDQYILKARKIIYFIYMDSRIKNPNDTEQQHREYVAHQICLLGNTEDKKSMNKYICLLNFLDFLETVSFFVDKGYISSSEINELMDQSLVFFYTIFEKRIIERRQKYNDKSFYTYFEKLVEQMRNKK